MDNQKLQSSLNLLRLARRESDSIGCAISFGKDSLATLDLCCRIFSRVEGYYLYRVADLEIVEEWSDAVRARYGVSVRMYPHFDLSRCYRYAVLQPHWSLPKVPKIGMADIDDVFRRDASVDWIAYGWRRNDSFSRALIMKKCAGYDSGAKRLFPLRSWARRDVYEYLDSRGIPRPPTLGRKEQGGLDFNPKALNELKEKYPSDYAKWLKDFPLSDLQAQ